ncbi:MAG: hypothetical protein KDE14_12215, partial [Rhodobacteraceae bacterium]|nr:hypothetical protein [Paracoccaceae bacterium]
MKHISNTRPLILSAAFTLAACLIAGTALAQSARDLDERLRRLERSVSTLQGQPSEGGTVDGMAPGNDLAGLSVRILKLEQLVEQLTGQIEETRFASGQTAARVEQLSDDVSYRLTVLEQTLGVSGAVAASVGGAQAMAAPQTA